MTYDPERYDAPSYEGEVTEESAGLRPRTWVAIGALGIGAVLALTQTWTLLIALIVAYFLWMLIRDAARRRARNRAWEAVANNVMEVED